MFLCLAHVRNGPDPERADRAASPTQGACGAGGHDAFGLLVARNPAHVRAAVGRRVAGEIAGPFGSDTVDVPGARRASRTRQPVIVLDASVVLEVLLRMPAGVAVEERLFEPEESLHVPHLVDVEVAQVLRRYALAAEVEAGRCRAALDDLAGLPLTRYPHDFLMSRVWDLRGNLSAYDAVYVALAEALDAPLLTRDRRLANAPGHGARVEVV